MSSLLGFQTHCQADFFLDHVCLLVVVLLGQLAGPRALSDCSCHTLLVNDCQEVHVQVPATLAGQYLEVPSFAQLTIGTVKVVKGPGINAGPKEIMPQDVKLYVPVSVYKKWKFNTTFGKQFEEFLTDMGLGVADDTPNPAAPAGSGGGGDPAGSGGEPPAKRSKPNPEHVVDLKTVTEALLVEVKLATSPLKLQSRVGKTFLANTTNGEVVLPKWPGLPQNNLMICKGHTCKMVPQLCRDPPPVIPKHIHHT